MSELVKDFIKSIKKYQTIPQKIGVKEFSEFSEHENIPLSCVIYDDLKEIVITHPQIENLDNFQYNESSCIDITIEAFKDLNLKSIKEKLSNKSISLLILVKNQKKEVDQIVPMSHMFFIDFLVEKTEGNLFVKKSRTSGKGKFNKIKNITSLFKNDKPNIIIQNTSYETDVVICALIKSCLLQNKPIVYSLREEMKPQFLLRLSNALLRKKSSNTEFSSDDIFLLELYFKMVYEYKEDLNLDDKILFIDSLDNFLEDNSLDYIEHINTFAFIGMNRDSKWPKINNIEKYNVLDTASNLSSKLVFRTDNKNKFALVIIDQGRISQNLYCKLK